MSSPDGFSGFQSAAAHCRRAASCSFGDSAPTSFFFDAANDVMNASKLPAFGASSLVPANTFARATASWEYWPPNFASVASLAPSPLALAMASSHSSWVSTVVSHWPIALVKCSSAARSSRFFDSRPAADSRRVVSLSFIDMPHVMAWSTNARSYSSGMDLARSSPTSSRTFGSTDRYVSTSAPVAERAPSSSAAASDSRFSATVNFLISMSSASSRDLSSFA